MPICYKYLKMIGIGIHKQFFLSFLMKWADAFCLLMEYLCLHHVQQPLIHEKMNEGDGSLLERTCLSNMPAIQGLPKSAPYLPVFLSQISCFSWIISFTISWMYVLLSLPLRFVLFFSPSSFSIIGFSFSSKFSYASELLAILNQPCHMSASLKRIPLSSKSCLYL